MLVLMLSGYAVAGKDFNASLVEATSESAEQKSSLEAKIKCGI